MPLAAAIVGATFLEGIGPSVRGDFRKRPNRDLSSNPEKSLGCPPHDKFHFVVWGLRS